MSGDGRGMPRAYWGMLVLAACRTQAAEPTVVAAPPPLVSASTSASAASAPAATPGVVALPIPARAQAAESPPSGWCGETAIQEGLLHIGIWAPQRLVNRSGNPAHADLYSNEIPIALAAFGVKTTTYRGGRGYDAFAKWVRAAVDAGDPVLAGVKLVPSEHPEWGLDHFVLAVGYGPEGVLVNTTWGRREWIGRVDKKMEAAAKAQNTQRISLENAGYGIRLDGPTLPAGMTRARLTLLEEGPETMKLRVSCGPRSRAERIDTTAEIVSKAGEGETTVAADRVARFGCRP